jgi:hypothetical protein
MRCGMFENTHLLCSLLECGKRWKWKEEENDKNIENTGLNKS